ncbi:hypothetical protein VCHA53O466_140067 [Vibrio chagasii]|nr:hypothetical protein VCHA53O466_140067 [Vibrio chagasii]
MSVITEPHKWTIYHQLIKDARNNAISEARRHEPVTRSRGVWLNGSDSTDVTLNENTDNSSKQMSGKSFLKDAEDLINRGATCVTIEGGVDSAANLFEMNNGNYTPWAAEWSIKVWTEAEGWLNEPVSSSS